MGPGCGDLGEVEVRLDPGRRKQAEVDGCVFGEGGCEDAAECWAHWVSVEGADFGVNLLG